MKIRLIDTGPFVAYLDRDDPAHAAIAEILDSYSGRLATTPAVITETMHLLARIPDGPALAAELIAGGDIETFECTRPSQLVQAAALMRKHRDTPMDFADATLVLLADDIGVTDIVTLDRRGFSTYRTPAGKRFMIVGNRR